MTTDLGEPGPDVQFAVWRLRRRGNRSPLAMIVQHARSFDQGLRIVAPLLPKAELPELGRLRPLLQFQGEPHRCIVDRMSVVSMSDFLSFEGDASANADQIKRAIDELFFGT